MLRRILFSSRYIMIIAVVGAFPGVLALLLHAAIVMG